MHRNEETTNLATAYFNDGAYSYVRAMELMKIPANHNALKHFHKMDKLRKDAADRRKRDQTKERRIELRRMKAKRAEARKKCEGTTYQAGGFGEDIDEGRPPPKKALTKGSRSKLGVDPRNKLGLDPRSKLGLDLRSKQEQRNQQKEEQLLHRVF